VSDENHETQNSELPALETESLRIPMNPCEASLVFVGGDRKEVVFFLSPSSGLHPGVETIEEFLGGDRTFLPARLEADEENVLVNRRSLLYLEVGQEAPTLLSREESAAVPMEIVRVELEGGEAVEGALRMHGPIGNQRISDEFNREEDFLPLESADKVIYFNKHRVTVVSF
jgi:hypothetical protein